MKQNTIYKQFFKPYSYFFAETDKKNTDFRKLLRKM